MLRELWMVEWLVQDKDRPTVVRNPDGSTFPLCGFLPVFAQRETAEAFQVNCRTDAAIKCVTLESQV